MSGLRSGGAVQVLQPGYDTSVDKRVSQYRVTSASSQAKYSTESTLLRPSSRGRLPDFPTAEERAARAENSAVVQQYGSNKGVANTTRTIGPNTPRSHPVQENGRSMSTPRPSSRASNYSTFSAGALSSGAGSIRTAARANSILSSVSSTNSPARALPNRSSRIGRSNVDYIAEQQLDKARQAKADAQSSVHQAAGNLPTTGETFKIPSKGRSPVLRSTSHPAVDPARVQQAPDSPVAHSISSAASLTQTYPQASYTHMQDVYGTAPLHSVQHMGSGLSSTGPIVHTQQPSRFANAAANAASYSQGHPAQQVATTVALLHTLVPPVQTSAAQAVSAAPQPHSPLLLSPHPPTQQPVPASTAAYLGGSPCTVPHPASRPSSSSTHPIAVALMQRQGSMSGADRSARADQGAVSGVMSSYPGSPQAYYQPLPSSSGTPTRTFSVATTSQAQVSQQQTMSSGASAAGYHPGYSSHSQLAPHSTHMPNPTFYATSVQDTHPTLVHDASRDVVSSLSSYSTVSAHSSGSTPSSISDNSDSSSSSSSSDDGVAARTTRNRVPSLQAVLPNLAQGQGCVGLQNLGNTCFMNSILQSLNGVPELVAWFLLEKDRKWRDNALVAPAFAELLNSMWSSKYGGVVSPSVFLKRLSKQDSRWGEGRQQDSQEFLQRLLETLQTECNRVQGKPQYRELDGKGTEQQQAAAADSYAQQWHDSIVDDLFGGQLQSTIQCQVCKRQSHRFDPFLDLAIPIPSTKSGNVSVQDCLQNFVELEKLEGSESYKCEQCKKCQPHSKRLQIWRPPRVLVLTLKRFSSRASSTSIFSRFRSTSKNNSAVNIEVDCLDLSNYCNPLGKGSYYPPTYQLVGVSHHSGSLEGGHYTATVRSASDGAWYHFNDASVRRDSKPAGPSSSAYVLFYRLTTPTGSL